MWGGAVVDGSEPVPDPLVTEPIERPTVEHLAELLRALRRRHARRQRDSELTYRELAARTGWSLTAIAEYFSGKTLPPTDRFDVLVNLLGTSPAEQHRLATARDRVEEHRRNSRPRRGRSSPAVSKVLASTQAGPRQLPTAVRKFVGRAAEMMALTSLLDLPGTAVNVAISGAAGIGKTALAVHWAHQISHRFPDGQLFVNLRGFDPSGPAVDPDTAMRQILDALNVPTQRVPADPDARAALYRSQLAGRRMVILLDNARDTAQVRPLLPGASECLVLVTSRNQLTSLVAVPGARPINLELLTFAEAREVLAGRLGVDRVEAEPAAVEEIILHCGRLPLALVIVASRAATHPRLSLRALAGQLADSRERLNILTVDDDPYTDVRAVLSWSCHALTPSAARLFRLLGWWPGPSVSAEAAAVLADLDQAETRQLLDVLTAVHLLEDDAQGRYRYHDLLRVYAAEQANAVESATARVRAAKRILDWYLHRTVAAVQMLEPGHRLVLPSLEPPPVGAATFATHEQALEWCDVEQAGALARAQIAADTGHDEHVWKLFVSSGSYFLLRKAWADRIVYGGIALRAVRRLGDRHGEAWVLNSLGLAYFASRRDEALQCFQQALRIRQEIGDLQGEAATLNNLGPVYWDVQRFDDAIATLWRALNIARETGNQHSEAIALNNLGEAYLRLRRFGDALPPLRQALALTRKLNRPVGEGFALHNLGGIYRELRQFGDSLKFFQEALAVRRLAGDRHGEATTIAAMGNLFREDDQLETALRSWHEALMIYEELGAPETSEIRRQIEETALRSLGAP
jgi:tetratricopeptide (TPR) repeat protein/transcriptional regulator with XRE-family HTH domain